MTDAVLVRLHDLLLTPDPPELIGRGHVQTCAGDSRRRLTVFPTVFMVWLQRRHLARDGEPELSQAQRYPAERTVGRVVTMKARG